ncbi:MAG TPA: FAD-linked oxidase C-terminal domain-containing protein [Solirubrobacterales bacterium]|jgi:alkyldihydroxyacetonephosphate synthase
MASRGDRLKHWGWGRESQAPEPADVEALAPLVRERLGIEPQPVEAPTPLEAIELPAPRIEPPASLAGVLTADRYERVSRALGKAYRDVVRGMRGRIEHPPDLVATPRTEADVERVLAWCAEQGFAVIPFGGGTSVVGGVEPRLPREYPAVVTLDVRGLDRVLEIDEVSRAALIEAGATGPRLEDQLREHGYTLRCFPQSFEFSTLGGWIATRAGGHFATRLTHIDDMVESIRALTPSGTWESRRLPGSGAGPSPDRLLLGSEGILGVITRAWVRVLERPRFRATCPVAFAGLREGAAAVRELAQSGLDPANCRLLDHGEAAISGAGTGEHALLMLGFESAHSPVDGKLRVALEVVRAHGGHPGEIRTSGGGSDDASGTWRQSFLAAPYLRDSLVQLGVLTETFETAITWDRFEDFHATVSDTARRAAAEAIGAPASGPGSPRVTCRFTHVYPDGPAPYYTVLAPARRGSEVEQWDAVKAAVSEAIVAAGGTITHHHAVGRDHRPWYDRQRPDPFAEALAAAKRAVDPGGVMNPGVLVD